MLHLGIRNKISFVLRFVFQPTPNSGTQGEVKHPSFSASTLICATVQRITSSFLCFFQTRANAACHPPYTCPPSSSLLLFAFPPIYYQCKVEGSELS